MYINNIHNTSTKQNIFAVIKNLSTKMHQINTSFTAAMILCFHLPKHQIASIKPKINALLCISLVAAMQRQPPWGKLWVYIRRNHRLVSLAAVRHFAAVSVFTCLPVCLHAAICFELKKIKYYGSICHAWHCHSITSPVVFTTAKKVGVKEAEVFLCAVFFFQVL